MQQTRVVSRRSAAYHTSLQPSGTNAVAVIGLEKSVWKDARRVFAYATSNSQARVDILPRSESQCTLNDRLERVVGLELKAEFLLEVLFY